MSTGPSNPSMVYIGCGAGFAGDRFDASLPIVESLRHRKGPRYLIFEVLAERTLAIAQRLRIEDPDKGYSPFLDDYVKPVLARAKANNVRIVSNFGAANPAGAGRRVMEIAREQGIEDLKVAVVEGDNLMEMLSPEEIRAWPTMEGLEIGGQLIAANCYLGARPIAAALAMGADVVAVGRSTDTALVLGPLVHEFGWAEDDWDRLAVGTVAGHLLECGGQSTGTYFADPGYKDVPDLARAGYPIAEVSRDGRLVITKPERTGGLVSEQTIKEQLLYEVHDPANYLTPDVVLDVSQVSVAQVGDNRVEVRGAKGKPRPETLKATVSFEGGWLGEGEITYAGPNSLARATLAVDVLRERCRILGMNCPVRFDIIGTVSTFDADDGSLREQRRNDPDGDYRVRASARSVDKTTVEKISNEVLSLYCAGPAAGGGVRQHLTPQVQTASILVDRDRVAPRISLAD